MKRMLRLRRRQEEPFRINLLPVMLVNVLNLCPFLGRECQVELFLPHEPSRFLGAREREIEATRLRV